MRMVLGWGSVSKTFQNKDLGKDPKTRTSPPFWRSKKPVCPEHYRWCNVRHITLCQNLYNISTCLGQGRTAVPQNGTRSHKNQDSHFKKVRFDSKHCKNPSELCNRGEMSSNFFKLYSVTVWITYRRWKKTGNKETGAEEEWGDKSYLEVEPQVLPMRWLNEIQGGASDVFRSWFEYLVEWWSYWLK